MKAFGLELRRTGDVTTLYKDVDSVLRNSGITRESVGGHVQQSAVAHALQNMITRKDWFDVCTVKECAELCQVRISNERMNVYRTVHCMHWDQMTDQYRQQVCAMLLDDFRVVLTATPQDLATR